MTRIKDIKNPTKKILFLGYSQSQTKLIDALVANNCIVDHTEEKIEATKGYDCVVSYGYKHILKQNMIDGLDCPISNLNISYFPIIVVLIQIPGLFTTILRVGLPSI